MPEWKYLWSEAFKSRYVLAAWLLKDYLNIVEIGGYRTPITDFLDLDGGRHQSITVFDPRCAPRHEWFGGRCGQVRIDHHDVFWDGKGFQRPTVPFGLAMLGMELHLTEESWKELFAVARFSQRTVIEYPIAHPHSVAQYARIVREANMRAIFEVTLNLDGNNFGDLTDSAPPMTERRVVALETR